MTIKEFFKDCAWFYHVWIFVYQIDESGGCQFDAKAICNFKDLDNFIDDYGDEEFKDWTFENSEYDAIIAFYLK